MEIPQIWDAAIRRALLGIKILHFACYSLYIYVARDGEKCHFIQSGKSNIVVIFHTRMEPECSLGCGVAQLKDIIGLKRVSISVHFAGEKEPFKKSELLKLKMRKIIFVSGRRDHTRLTRGRGHINRRSSANCCVTRPRDTSHHRRPRDT